MSHGVHNKGVHPKFLELGASQPGRLMLALFYTNTMTWTYATSLLTQD